MGICSSKNQKGKQNNFDPSLQKTNQTDLQNNTARDSTNRTNRTNRKSRTQLAKTQRISIIPQVRKPITSNSLRMSIESLSKHYSLINIKHLSRTQNQNLVQHNISGEIRRITTLKKDPQNTRYIQWLLDEEYVHPHIARIIDIFQDKQKFHVISEYCSEGDLSNLVSKGPVFEEVCIIIIEQILKIIQHFHEMNIAFGKLSIRSFGLLGKTMNYFVKLANIFDIQDFYLLESENNNSKEQQETAQTIHKQNQQKDIRVVGIIAYCLMTGQEELEKDEKININKLHNLSNSGKEFIINLFKNPLQMTISQYLNTDWIKKAESCLHQMYIRPLLNLQNAQSITYLHQCFLVFMIDYYEGDFESHVLELFKKFQITKDSSLTKTQLSQLIHQTIYGKMNINIDELFLKIDIDKNGTIQFNELIIAMINKSELLKESYLIECFTKLSNSSGLITQQSLLKRIEATPQTLKEQFDLFTSEKNFNQKQFIEFMQILCI